MKKKEKSKASFMDTLIVSIFIGLVIFITVMTVTFVVTGIEQTTLITSVFTLVTAELAFCWRIKAAKLKGAKDPEALEQAIRKTYKDEEDEEDAGSSDEDY